MCGFVGIVNYKKDLSSSINLIEKMNKKISKRGPDNKGYHVEKNILFGHNRLAIIDIENGLQPMSFKYNDCNYTIIYNGQIYNANDLRIELKELGMSFNTRSDTEVLLKGYVVFGKSILNKLNGIFSFAIWNSKTQEIFAARDHLGVKPFYYTNCNSNFIIASEIKSILAHNEVETVVDEMGFKELLGIGPAHTPGFTVFKNIFELKPAHFLIYNKNGLYIEKYWKLKSSLHTDNFATTCENVKYLLEDSIKRQLVSDVPIGTMLSGGLDSSIISHYANKYIKENNIGKLNTFSVTYKDNEKNFVKSDFQPNSDEHYINIMTNKYNTNHRYITLDTEDLANYLKDAVIARDYPGMADIDSSMLLFCKEIKKDVKVVLSGECADEIFGGYPWFFRKDALESNTFPWSIALEERQQLLSPDLFYNVNLKEYIDFRYKESLKEIDYLSPEITNNLESIQKDPLNPNTITINDYRKNKYNDKKDIFHLNYYWFMQNLLDRADKMSMYNGLEVRVPFCDYRLIQYLWNIPWEMKSMNGREKGLLRYIARDILPSEIVDRKKSPYPKTHNPTYSNKVKELLTVVLEDNNSPINNILNKEYLKEILDTDGKAFTRPWFGQLMTGPQLMAYLIQFNDWLEIYKPRIEIF